MKENKTTKKMNNTDPINNLKSGGVPNSPEGYTVPVS